MDYIRKPEKKMLIYDPPDRYDAGYNSACIDFEPYCKQQQDRIEQLEEDIKELLGKLHKARLGT